MPDSDDDSSGAKGKKGPCKADKVANPSPVPEEEKKVKTPKRTKREKHGSHDSDAPLSKKQRRDPDSKKKKKSSGSKTKKEKKGGNAGEAAAVPDPDDTKVATSSTAGPAGGSDTGRRRVPPTVEVQDPAARVLDPRVKIREVVTESGTVVSDPVQVLVTACNFLEGWTSTAQFSEIHKRTQRYQNTQSKKLAQLEGCPKKIADAKDWIHGIMVDSEGGSDATGLFAPIAGTPRGRAPCRSPPAVPSPVALPPPQSSSSASSTSPPAGAVTQSRTVPRPHRDAKTDTDREGSGDPSRAEKTREKGKNRLVVTSVVSPPEQTPNPTGDVDMREGEDGKEEEEQDAASFTAGAWRNEAFTDGCLTFGELMEEVSRRTDGGWRTYVPDPALQTQSRTGDHSPGEENDALQDAHVSPPGPTERVHRDRAGDRLPVWIPGQENVRDMTEFLKRFRREDPRGSPSSLLMPSPLAPTYLASKAAGAKTLSSGPTDAWNRGVGDGAIDRENEDEEEVDEDGGDGGEDDEGEEEGDGEDDDEEDEDEEGDGEGNEDGEGEEGMEDGPGDRRCAVADPDGSESESQPEGRGTVPRDHQAPVRSSEADRATRRRAEAEESESLRRVEAESSRLQALMRSRSASYIRTITHTLPFWRDHNRRAKELAVSLSFKAVGSSTHHGPSSSNIPVIKHEHVLKVLVQPHGPFQRCMMGDQCTAMQIPHPEAPGGRIALMAFVYPEEYAAAIDTGRAPGQRRFCYLCTLVRISLDWLKNCDNNHVNSPIALPFTFITGVPGEYNLSAMITPKNGHTEGLTSPFRNFTDFDLEPCTLEVNQRIYLGGGQTCESKQQVYGFRERAELDPFRGVYPSAPLVFPVVDGEALTTERLLEIHFSKKNQVFVTYLGGCWKHYETASDRSQRDLRFWRLVKQIVERAGVERMFISFERLASELEGYFAWEEKLDLERMAECASRDAVSDDHPYGLAGARCTRDSYVQLSRLLLSDFVWWKLHSSVGPTGEDMGGGDRNDTRPRGITHLGYYATHYRVNVAVGILSSIRAQIDARKRAYEGRMAEAAQEAVRAGTKRDVKTSVGLPGKGGSGGGGGGFGEDGSSLEYAEAVLSGKQAPVEVDNHSFRKPRDPLARFRTVDVRHLEARLTSFLASHARIIEWFSERLGAGLDVTDGSLMTAGGSLFRERLVPRPPLKLHPDDLRLVRFSHRLDWRPSPCSVIRRLLGPRLPRGSEEARMLERYSVGFDKTLRWFEGLESDAARRRVVEEEIVGGEDPGDSRWIPECMAATVRDYAAPGEGEWEGPTVNIALAMLLRINFALRLLEVLGARNDALNMFVMTGRVPCCDGYGDGRDGRFSCASFTDPSRYRPPLPPDDGGAGDATDREELDGHDFERTPESFEDMVGCVRRDVKTLTELLYQLRLYCSTHFGLASLFSESLVVLTDEMLLSESARACVPIPSGSGFGTSYPTAPHHSQAPSAGASSSSSSSSSSSQPGRPGFVVRKVSPYVMCYPSKRRCIHEGDLPDLSRVLPEVMFIISNPVEKRIHGLFYKIMPGVCHVRIFLEKHVSYCIVDTAYERWARACTQVSLMGMYRECRRWPTFSGWLELHRLFATAETFETEERDRLADTFLNLDDEEPDSRRAIPTDRDARGMPMVPGPSGITSVPTLKQQDGGTKARGATGAVGNGARIVRGKGGGGGGTGGSGPRPGQTPGRGASGGNNSSNKRAIKKKRLSSSKLYALYERFVARPEKARWTAEAARMGVRGPKADALWELLNVATRNNPFFLLLRKCRLMIMAVHREYLFYLVDHHQAYKSFVRSAFPRWDQFVRNVRDTIDTARNHYRVYGTFSEVEVTLQCIFESDTQKPSYRATGRDFVRFVDWLCTQISSGASLVSAPPALPSSSPPSPPERGGASETSGGVTGRAGLGEDGALGTAVHAEGSQVPPDSPPGGAPPDWNPDVRLPPPTPPHPDSCSGPTTEDRVAFRLSDELVRALRAYVASLEPCSPINVTALLMFGISPLGFVRLAAAAKLYSEGGSQTEVNEGIKDCFLSMSLEDYELVHAFFRFVGLHYQLTVVPVSRAVALAQLDAIGRRYRLKPGDPITSVMRCIMFCPGCREIKTFTSESGGVSFYGHFCINWDVCRRNYYCEKKGAASAASIEALAARASASSSSSSARSNADEAALEEVIAAETIDVLASPSSADPSERSTLGPTDGAERDGGGVRGKGRGRSPAKRRGRKGKGKAGNDEDGGTEEYEEDRDGEDDEDEDECGPYDDAFGPRPKRAGRDRESLAEDARVRANRKLVSEKYAIACSAEPLVPIDLLGFVLQYTESWKANGTVSYTICTGCGQFFSFSVSAYGPNGMTCGRCDAEDRARFASDTCEVCRIRLSNKRRTQVHVCDDGISGSARIHRVYVCLPCFKKFHSSLSRGAVYRSVLDDLSRVASSFSSTRRRKR